MSGFAFAFSQFYVNTLFGFDEDSVDELGTHIGEAFTVIII